jgi:hypothetical protein
MSELDNRYAVSAETESPNDSSIYVGVDYSSDDFCIECGVDFANLDKNTELAFDEEENGPYCPVCFEFVLSALSEFQGF